MFTIERLQRIRRTLLEKKRVEVAELSRDFGLSESTIRRDLDKLEKEGFLRKTYGGAVLADGGQIGTGLEPVEEEHDKIARMAAEMVADGDAIFLGGGPTCLRLASYLGGKQRVTVATNDLEVAMCLSEAPYVSVKVIGSDLLPGTSTLVDQDVAGAVGGFLFNKAFFYPSGVDLKFGYAVPSLGEAQLIQAVIRVARETIAVLDHAPFGRVALAPVIDLAGLQTVVTSNLLPGAFKAYYLEHQVKVFIAYEIANPGQRRGLIR